MLNPEVLTKRLALIKRLYKHGLQLSQQEEPMCAFSILIFHDSIEMFLKLLAEHEGIKSEKFDFMAYWDNIAKLTLKESIRNLNKRRVNIKHYGLLPSKMDVETSRVNVSDFFEQNTSSCFDIEFENISLIYLIDLEEIKSCLVQSQNALAKEDYKESIENSSIAFHKMILIYENSKTYFTNSSPFSFRRKRLKLDIQQLELGDRRKVDEVMSYISERFDFIEEIVKILSVGIDYRKYLKFKIITPKVLHYGKHAFECQIFEDDSWTKEQCEYCFDFVIETALTLQAFDFDIDEIKKNPYV